MHYTAHMTPEHQVLLSAVGAAVRRLRDDRAMTRRDLAERSGVSERFLAELEGGQGNISVARLQDVARALGSSAGELLFAAQHERTGRGGAANPQAQVELRALLKAREPLYAQAELSVDTSRTGVDGAVEEIARKLG